MKFVDEIDIQVRAGRGGAGRVSFHREKYVPRGGPDGGDGGRGGDVYLVAGSHLQTLGHLRRSRIYQAGNGAPGRGANRAGKTGDDEIIQVPQGTQVEDQESGKILADLIRPGEKITVARGGRGGLGNQHFATSVNQAPGYAQPGEPGEEKAIRLHLKLLADVGLVGLPNAGKSTVLSRLSRNHPKIADYPFTTLTPNIGIIENREYRRALLADIPGIIEGAARGAGLGLSFLRHIERVRMVVYIVDIGNPDPVSDIRILQREMVSYSPTLLERPALVAINKIDLVDFDEQFVKEFMEQLRRSGLFGPDDENTPDMVAIAARDDYGMEELRTKIFAVCSDETLAEKMIGMRAIENLQYSDGGKDNE